MTFFFTDLLFYPSAKGVVFEGDGIGGMPFLRFCLYQSVFKVVAVAPRLFAVLLMFDDFS